MSPRISSRRILMTAAATFYMVFGWGMGLGPASAAAQSPSAEVATVLDNLHRLASEADFAGYFALYTDDAVFLGTDATERWTKAEFQDYARGSFDAGRGWSYTPTERHIFLSPDGSTAWFDERLTNSSFGETRGTGVLVRDAGEWKIAQYNLTIPIPNQIAREVVGRIRTVTGG